MNTQEPLAGGDILLRASGEPDSQAIIHLSRGTYSHAGICGPEASTAIDAFPRDGSRDVALSNLDDFFSPRNASAGGAVFRYGAKTAKAQAAARWAAAQCDAKYVFDICDPILGLDRSLRFNHRVYCSEFVWRCYREGANVTLIDPRDFANLFQGRPVAQDQQALVDLVREYLGSSAAKVPVAFIIRWIKLRHNGRFITPTQLAQSKFVSRVRDYPVPDAPAGPVGAPTSAKKKRVP